LFAIPMKCGRNNWTEIMAAKTRNRQTGSQERRTEIPLSCVATDSQDSSDASILKTMVLRPEMRT
jgi:hypothetical protein